MNVYFYTKPCADYPSLSYYNSVEAITVTYSLSFGITIFMIFSLMVIANIQSTLQCMDSGLINILYDVVNV